jgi:hypothetical protein
MFSLPVDILYNYYDPFKVFKYNLKKIFLVVLGIQGLLLALQILYYLSHTPALFCFGYFSDRVLSCCWGLTLDFGLPA